MATPVSTANPSTESKLRQSDHRTAAVPLILGDVLGASIYALMGVLSQEVGGALWAPLGDVARVTQLPTGASPATAVLGAAVIAYYSFVGFETSARSSASSRWWRWRSAPC